MRGLPVDSISSLPDSIIEHILKFLPLRDAVKTSTLSSEWVYKWRTIPHLVFDQNFIASLNPNYDLESTIARILLCHEGTKFRLMGCERLRRPTISRWLLNLLDHHHVEHFALGFHEFGELNMVPDHLFSLDELTVLFIKSEPNAVPVHWFGLDELTGLFIKSVPVKLPPAFKGLSRLVTLKLHDVEIELGELHTLLSKCPMLKCLDLKVPRAYVNPNLSYEDNHLTLLRLDGIHFKWPHFGTCVHSLITSSPSLKTLEISLKDYHGEDDDTEDLEDDHVDDIKFVMAKWAQNCRLNCLEQVMIDGMLGYREELEFVKILLQGATALEKLQIKCVPRESGWTESGWREFPDFALMLAELSGFPLASSRGKVIFNIAVKIVS